MGDKKPSDLIDDLAERIGRVRRTWDEAEYLRCEAERAEEGTCREICWLVIDSKGVASLWCLTSWCASGRDSWNWNCVWPFVVSTHGVVIVWREVFLIDFRFVCSFRSYILHISETITASIMTDVVSVFIFFFLCLPSWLNTRVSEKIIEK